MADLYKAGDLIKVSMQDGSELVFGTVIEDGWKRLGYIFSARLPNKSFVFFDARKLPALKDAIERASAAHRKRLESMATEIHNNFASRDAFLMALVGIAERS